MTHHALTVALPGDVLDLQAGLDALMYRYSELRAVELHRDTSVYAEPLADQLTRARACAGRDTIPGYAERIVTMTDVEIGRDWSGAEGFDEDGWPLTTRNPEGRFDYCMVGGMYAGAYVLRPGAEAGPLKAQYPDERANEPRRTDCARWRDIMPESVEPTYAWVDLDGEWHTRWIGPRTREEALSYDQDTSGWEMPTEVSSALFMTFLRSLPGDAWLVNVDYHN